MMGSDSSTRSVTALWQLVSGPIVWTMHFMSMYAAQSLACRSLGASNHILWIGAGLTFIALAAISWFSFSRNLTRSIDAPVGFPASLRKLAFGLHWLSALAIMWTAAPLLFIPSCSTAG